jgi:hypothetical protein
VSWEVIREGFREKAELGLAWKDGRAVDQSTKRTFLACWLLLWTHSAMAGHLVSKYLLAFSGPGMEEVNPWKDLGICSS